MNRRGFIVGLGSAIIAAPAIVRSASLMKLSRTMVLTAEDSAHLTALGHRYFGQQIALCWSVEVDDTLGALRVPARKVAKQIVVRVRGIVSGTGEVLASEMYLTGAPD